MADKLPPFDLEAERCVLGLMMKCAELIPDVKEKLVVDMFYRPAHQLIAAALYDYDAGGDIVLIQLRDMLTKRNQLESVTMDYLKALMGKYTGATSNIDHYIDVVRRTAVLRLICTLGDSMRADACNAVAADVDDMIKGYQDQLFSMDARADQGESMIELGPAAEDAVAHADKVAAGEVPPGLPTGFAHIDRVTGGMQLSDLWILAAATSVGKTALSLAIAANVAAAGGSVLYVSLEMNRQAIANRMIGMRTGIDGLRLRSGQLNEYEARDRADAVKQMRTWKMAVIDRSCTIGDVGIRARQLCARWSRPLDLIVVDYLQLLRTSGDDKKASRAQEVGGLAMGLKSLSMTIQTPILALSQLNRAGVKSAGAPSLHDLKESGDVENTANVAVLLHRPETPEFETGGRAVLWARVAKARDGQVTPWPAEGFDGIKLAFRSHCALMEPITL